MEMMFARELKRRGRSARKARISGIPKRETLNDLADGGKTNKNNNVTFTGALPNKNLPLFAINAKAAMLFYRIVVNPPSPLEPAQPAHSHARRAVHRSWRSPSMSAPPTQELNETFPDLLNPEAYYKTFIIKDLSSSEGREGV
eukprot:7388900-Prymnesium_polylepis.1